ncbi:MAG TPA: xanthine dehydrogenase family protein subunit M [Flavitalea sp.]|nr:xanthine dehydrogenase family protein subunit M [Flavitalea sp.]
MINFQYTKASSTASAVAAIKKDSSSAFIAGGTNLVDLMKKGVTSPQKLIDITHLDLSKIEKHGNKIIIGSLALNSIVADDEMINKDLPLLALALKAGASPQIRNMATIGGNMMQRTRCPYFNSIDMPCNKREPGSGCGALKGYNRMHAIFGASDKCIAVHPSDMCIALAALDAKVNVIGSKGRRHIEFSEFHRLPGDLPQKDNTLAKDELIVSIEVPENKFTKNVHYLKVRDRSSYAFALVSVAVALSVENGSIREAHLAMGGVAHKPWRLSETERFLKGKNISQSVFNEAGQLSVHDAKGYGYNNFKIKLSANSIAEALQIAAAKS